MISLSVGHGITACTIVIQNLKKAKWWAILECWRCVKSFFSHRIVQWQAGVCLVALIHTIPGARPPDSLQASEIIKRIFWKEPFCLWETLICWQWKKQFEIIPLICPWFEVAELVDPQQNKNTMRALRKTGAKHFDRRMREFCTAVAKAE